MSHQYLHILPMTALTLLSATTSAQTTSACPNTPTCSSIDTSNVKYIGGGIARNYTPSSTPTYTPDTRPVYWLQMYDGPSSRDCTTDSNPKAHAPYWLDARWDTGNLPLEERLDLAYAAGFRRIVLNRPGGNVGKPTGSYPTSLQQAHYWHLTNDQKDVIQSTTNGLSQWITDKGDVDVGVYIGSWQYDSCSPCMNVNGGRDNSTTYDFWDCSSAPSLGNEIFNDPTDETSMEELYENVKPWMDAGLTEVWFDNASYDPDMLFDIQQSPDYDGIIRMGGETVPTVSAPGPVYTVNDTYATAVPWVALYRYGLSNKPGLWDDTVNSSTQEVGIVFQYDLDSSYGFGIEEMADARDNGFVLWVDRPANFKYIQRLYDGDNDELYNDFYANGDLTDFNADGTSGDEDDFNAFCTNWNANRTLSGDDLAYWDGDIDNDDDVDCDDLAAFLSLKTWGYSCLNPCP